MADTVDWSRSILAEHRVADIIARQERRGVYFDTQRAKWYIHLLTERILKIDIVAVPLMPKRVIQGRTYNKPFKKNGDLSVAASKWVQEFGVVVSGPFSTFTIDDFDFGKVGLFKDWMLKQGWIPDAWNIKNLTVDTAGKKLAQDDMMRVINGYMDDLRTSASGKLRMEMLGIKKGMTVSAVKQLLLKKRIVPTTPKLTETSFHTVDTPLGTMVMERMVWSHRRSLLEGLVEIVRPDHRLSARANPCATPTARMRHSGVVNIPAARSPFGKELRSLFKAPIIDGVRWKFVGYDAAALEIRMFAHYLGNEEYTEQVLNGDIHSFNQKAAGLPTRDNAKVFFYGWLYGAGNSKIGSIVGGTAKDGAELNERFTNSIRGMKEFIDSTKQQAERGYLIGIDGRKLIMRRNETGEVMAHKALNTLLQGAGAIVMKYAMIILDDGVKNLGLRAHKVLDMHDEGQWECHPEDVAKLRQLMDNCVRLAGEQLNMNCPLASESKEGYSWYDTH